MSPIEHRLFQQPWPDGEYRFFQLGFLVDDVLAAAARWARVFGVGPFHVMPVIEQRSTYRGTPAAITMRVAVAQAGPVQIELIQQLCDRPSVYREWSRGGTCAFHQLATVTPDYDGTKAGYEELGYPTVAESLSGRFRVAFVDTVADFGFYTEVVESTPGFLANLGRMAQASAAWDGTDPLRLLGPDGRAR
ncbi:VOC family protein [Frankia sp. CNm7]|uniref:VOC family protein n=1 Tax=Frankia nepalensis TaxID=1836974 RepID=A0A937RCQ1_9ACTN|nr:VOC family protein [Frankia nepalensis]MBL7496707.1 VOC family protein [Frankia nepalensis]MBL7511063.1 VOC family protein [Frankia nepalensis]MBL7516715.1 VOC family protein [Frankia nepalensis]MBL7627447.1 VOC family protein [Frankia nepalensis]